MKKLFYTCPIEAAYMAKSFGVKFQYLWKDLFEQEPDEFFDIDVMELHPKYDEQIKIFYIHPDSISIFESQEGDIGKAKREGEAFPYIMTRLHHKWWCAVGAYRGDQKDIKIIQRNNKPFIMPESEE